MDACGCIPGASENLYTRKNICYHGPRRTVKRKERKREEKRGKERKREEKKGKCGKRKDIFRPK
jgi:hypothetical protein